MVEDFNFNKNILGCMQKTRASSRMMWLLSRPRRRPPTGALVPIAFWIGSPTMHSYRDGSLESSRTRNFPAIVFSILTTFHFVNAGFPFPTCSSSYAPVLDAIKRKSLPKCKYICVSFTLQSHYLSFLSANCNFPTPGAGT